MVTQFQIIKRPIVTEKGVDKKDSERTLCFEVHPDANKVMIKTAVEKLFKVKVVKVNTLNRKGKSKRGRRTARTTKLPDRKHAIATLTSDSDDIEIFQAG